MKQEKKLEARKLRLQGQSVPHIAQELGVSKGSVSIWVRDIKLKETQRLYLVSRKGSGGNKQSDTKRQKLLSADFTSLSTESKKRRVVIEQGGKCLNCGIDEWRDSPLTIQVDHIDGNNSNNARDNLRGLCPNCHSQTPTYCGKNRSGSKVLRVTDEVLLSALLTSKSISEALNKVGYTRARSHSERCKQLISQYSIGIMNDLNGSCKQCGSSFIKDSQYYSVFCSQSCAGKSVGGKFVTGRFKSKS